MRVSDFRPGLAAAVTAALLCLLVPSAYAQNNDLEDRLRAALRAATTQLRALQDQNAALQAKQTDLARQNQGLGAQLDSATKERDQSRQQIKADSDALQQSATRLDQTTTTLAAERESLAKWRSAFETAQAQARDRDAEAKRLDAALVATRKRVLDLTAKNTELYKIGAELIDLYANKGLLGVLGADEPVIGLKRVQLENLMQSYGDKLLENKAVPAQP